MSVFPGLRAYIEFPCLHVPRMRWTAVFKSRKLVCVRTQDSGNPRKSLHVPRYLEEMIRSSRDDLSEEFGWSNRLLFLTGLTYSQRATNVLYRLPLTIAWTIVVMLIGKKHVSLITAISG